MQIEDNDTLRARVRAALPEINHIQTDDLRRMTENAVMLAPTYFAAVPASSSGKHHPVANTNRHGLLNHTRWGAEAAHRLVDGTVADILDDGTLAELAEGIADGNDVAPSPDAVLDKLRSGYDFDQREHDYLVAGIVCHDLFKQGADDGCGQRIAGAWKDMANGDTTDALDIKRMIDQRIEERGWSRRYYDGRYHSHNEHDEIGEFLLSMAFCDTPYDHHIEAIERLTLTHNGPWYSDTEPTTMLEKVHHYADMASSRRGITFDIDPKPRAYQQLHDALGDR